MARTLAELDAAVQQLELKATRLREELGRLDTAWESMGSDLANRFEEMQRLLSALVQRRQEERRY